MFLRYSPCTISVNSIEEYRSLVACQSGNLTKQLEEGVTATFRGNNHAGIQNWSLSGGESGSRWLLTAASMSRPKSPSSVAVEPVRLGQDDGWPDTGARSTAIGSVPLSMMTSAPARACSRRVATLVVANIHPDSTRLTPTFFSATRLLSTRIPGEVRK
jgi:hypothetical protein